MNFILGGKAAEKTPPPESELSRPAKTVRLSVKRFRPNEQKLDALRAYGIGIIVRIAARLGYLVLLIGPCRSGKSFILDRTCPGAIFNTQDDFAKNGFRPLALDAGSLPVGKTFAIDEVGNLPDGWIPAARAALDTRRVVYVLQDIRMLEALEMGPLFHRRKVLMVNIEGRP